MAQRMNPETRLLHETLIRLAKGMLRAWEHWVGVQTGKEPPAIELPRSGDTP